MGCESNSNRFVSKRWIDNIEKLSVKLKERVETQTKTTYTQSNELDNLLDEIWNENEGETGIQADENETEGELDESNEEEDNNTEVLNDKSDCNKYGLCNVFIVGCKKMLKRDYKKCCLMKAIVEKRKDTFEEMIYKSVKAK